MAGCYFDRVSEPGVDAMDVNGRNDDREFDFDAIPPEIFRFGGASREEQSDTFLSSDIVRPNYADAPEGANGTIEDYDLELIAPGDWWNYTRNVEAGDYSAILRVSSETDAEFELGVVTSNPSQGNQTVDTLGRFAVTGRPGYQSISLTDSNGVLAGFPLSGEATLRITATSGTDAAINYLLLVPFTEEETPAGVLEGITLNGDGSITVTWSGGSGIERATSLANPDWQAVPNAASPLTIAEPSGAAFYRIAQ